MSDAVRRGLRGLIQSAFASAILTLLIAFGVQLTDAQVVAIMGVLTPLIGFVQNLLEDNTDFPAVLKAPPSGGQNPVP